MAKWWRTHSLRYDGHLGLYHDFYRKRFSWARRIAIVFVVALVVSLLTLSVYKEYLR